MPGTGRAQRSARLRTIGTVSPTTSMEPVGRASHLTARRTGSRTPPAFTLEVSMTPNRSRGSAVALAALVAALAASGCKGYSSPSAPYGTGSGGGGSSSAFSLGPFGLEQSAQLTFPNAGTFAYHCIPHESMGMRGAVQVDASGSDSALVQIAASGLTFSPATAH